MIYTFWHQKQGQAKFKDPKEVCEREGEKNLLPDVVSTNARNLGVNNQGWKLSDYWKIT